MICKTVKQFSLWSTHTLCGYSVGYPYIIKGTFIECVIVQAAESFTLSAEFISCCDNFTVTWQFNESYIANTDKYVINTTIIKRCHYKISLTVVQSSETDTGNYIVTVTSVTGKDSVTISVKIISKLKIASY